MSCPKCGYCAHCGRSNMQPYWTNWPTYIQQPISSGGTYMGNLHTTWTNQNECKHDEEEDGPTGSTS